MRKELVLPVTAAVSGAAGFFLRRWELASAFEADTGLPIPGMPATWALIALSAAAVLALALLCRGSHRVFPGGYDEAFSARGRTLYMAGMVAAAFLMVIAGALFLMELPQLYAEAKLQTKGTPMLGLLPRALLAVLALCSGWSLFQLGKNNYRGEGQGKYSSSLLIPAYTACMWLIVAYQARSGAPIILDYVYQLFAVIAAVLGSYFMAGFGFERAKTFRSAFFSLCAMYFILVTLADTHEPGFLALYLAFFLYFAASSAVLLYNARQPRGPRMPGKRLLKDTETEDLNREGTPDEG